MNTQILFFFFFSSRRRHTRYWRDWSSDVCSSDLIPPSYHLCTRFAGSFPGSGKAMQDSSWLRARSRVAQTGQFLRQRPQPLPGLQIVGLLFGACLTLPLEVASRDLPKIRVGSQVDRRVGALLHVARGATERLEDHLRTHERRRVQAVCGNARAFELPSQVEGEHDEGQLALGIRSHAVVAPL